MTVAYTLAELARRLDCPLKGDGAIEVSSLGTLAGAGQGQLSFAINARFAEALGATKASAVIIPQALERDCPVAALVAENPHVTYARAARLLYPPPAVAAGVHSTAVVADDVRLGQGASVGPHVVIETGAVIGDGVVIAPGCVVGRDAQIGDQSRMHANVSIAHGVKIGCRAIIHSGAVIGSDGFGLANDDGRWEKVPQLGTVVIGDDVEIGANTTIDRGALDDTVLEDGVKLDNQVHVAHNVRIGAHSAIAGCVGIAGSTQIGRRCQVAGATAIAGHITIADDVVISGMSMVTGNINRAGMYSSGVPLDDTQRWRKNAARFRSLDGLARKVAQLEKMFKSKQTPDG